MREQDGEEHNTASGRKLGKRGAVCSPVTGRMENSQGATPGAELRQWGGFAAAQDDSAWGALRDWSSLWALTEAKQIERIVDMIILHSSILIKTQ